MICSERSPWRTVRGDPDHRSGRHRLNDGQEPFGLPMEPGFLEAELDLPDQRIWEDCQRGGPLLPLECAALMHSYDALLAGVHDGEAR
jgi:hypothetical protein